MHDVPVVEWSERGAARSARWRSERGVPPPRRIVVADDTLKADAAYRLACEGTALMWRSDFQNARQMLVAMAARVDRPPRRRGAPAATNLPMAEQFNRMRLARAQRARTLGALLVELDAGYALALRRAPDVKAACTEAWGPGTGNVVTSVRELLGLIGAHEWRAKGIAVPAAGGRIHPYYGVFGPVRSEYVDLVAGAPLPRALAEASLAFDIGTGTGVLAAVLARRGVARVVATDRDPRALACARDNLARLGLGAHVDVVDVDLYPDGRAALVVCNPPWVPARPASPLEGAIYDPESRMLRDFLAGLAAHLAPGGEGWLVLSDLAEHLALRTREQLLAWIAGAGLVVAGRLDARPRHPKAGDANDALHAARAMEVTSLWRLTAA
ncbi:MAG: class I SAM-dependent methyltransferase [Proteobacteria bacterium]|nr:class I SAM-dependent methyltransferase [Pseudomonadota bacterium]